MNAPAQGIHTHKDPISEESLQVSLMEEPLHSESTGIPVLHLLTALRQYHQLRDLSHHERFGEPDPQSRQALSQLEQVQESLQALTARSGEHDMDIRVEASLNLKMSPMLS